MKKAICVMVVFMMLVLTVHAFAREKAKIVVAANGKTPQATISGQAGTASFFLFFDGKGKFLEATENPYKGKEGVGKSVIEYLAGKGVSVVVAEGFGGPIVDLMKSKGIKAIAAKGSAEEAVRKVLQAK
jgi:predicted Fe-Mo cluster-binding NifX family protein